MTPRVHVHLKATDLKASREFYRRFLGVEPVKDKADHVKFVMPFAPLNLVISPAISGGGAAARKGVCDVRISEPTQPASEGRAVNHLGLELPSSAAVDEYLKHVKHQGVKVREQLNVNCCYANQSKFWVIDPDGTEWEIYHVNYDLVEKHGGGIEELTADVCPEIA